MFNQLISTLKMVDDAISAKDTGPALTALTSALLQLIDIYSHDDSHMHKLLPVLEALREEIQHDNFEEARLINLALLASFREAQKIVMTSSKPTLNGGFDAQDITDRPDASGQVNLPNSEQKFPMAKSGRETQLNSASNHSTEHEQLWAREIDALNERLRLSGLNVVVGSSAQDAPLLVATFPQGRHKRRE